MTTSLGRRIAIMGIRGVPAQHGGFETFAERLAPDLVRRGWQVTVYCQEEEAGRLDESHWEGVRRVHIGVGHDTAVNSMRFDWACIRHAVQTREPLVLTLGYNTALFSLRLRLAGVGHVMNMDGIEWARDKWSLPAKAWLYLNDWAGCLGADHLIADHPQIARHLSRRVSTRKISTLPYGTDLVDHADPALLAPLGLQPGGYLSLIARPEPENSVLEIVRGFSARPRGVKLVVLGSYVPERVPYHAEVLAAAGPEVVFAGPIYEREVVQALRWHSLAYLHGHQVGGTNPSLLEAMGAANPVIAHDNRFNRWVVGEGAWYFRDATECAKVLDQVLADAGERRRRSELNRRRALTTFAWPVILAQYEVTLRVLHDRAIGVTGPVDPPYAGVLDSVNSMDMS